MELLVKPKLLEVITQRLSTCEPNAEGIIDKFKRSKLGRSRILDQSFHGYFAEAYLKSSLGDIVKDLVASDPSLKGRINSVNIENFKANHYNFFISSIGIPTVEYCGETVCDYDYLLEVDKVTTLFEIKMSKKKYSRGDKNSLNGAIDLRNIRNRLKPLKIANRNNGRYAYVVIVPPECVNEASPFQQTFKESNGIIVPFCMSLDEWKKFVNSELISRYKKV